MLVKLVLFKDVWGEQFYRHFRVFKSVHGRAKVEVPDIDTHESSIFRADDTVPQQFGSCEVYRSCGEFTWVIDEIPPAVILTMLGSAFCGR